MARMLLFVSLQILTCLKCVMAMLTMTLPFPNKIVSRYHTSRRVYTNWVG